MDNITEFNLPTNSYASFDAQSMRDLIIDRLNNDSSISFTDQNFQGSNLNAMIDIISYSFHTLLFYLNQTSSEAVFTDAQLYENMNRIVKLIDYKPLGKQTSVVPTSIKGTANLSSGYYTLPKFSFVTSNGKTYSTTKDLTFQKINSSVAETLSAIDSSLFYEGQVKEYPDITAIGEDFETVTLLPGDNINVDHFSTSVYVKENSTSTWYEYRRVPSLYLAKPNERVFESRLNQNKNYEITFGNNINGRSLVANEIIGIYYIGSTGTEGQITKNTFSDTSINVYNTTRYDNIFANIKDTTLNYVTVNDSVDIKVTNTDDSTLYSEEESVEDIRSNAPKFFSSEYKLITKNDYENFIDRNFKNFIYDIKVSNNSDYLNIFKKYLSDDLNLESYTDYNNALYNQYNFSDSFDVNNIFVTIVPKFKKDNSVVKRSNYVSTSLKNEILYTLSDYKLINSEITFIDPVYLATDLLLKAANELNRVDFKDVTELRIVRNSATIANDDTIKNKVSTIITNYFNKAKLGQLIDIKQLNTDIISIEGIDSFYTYRTDIQLKSNGLSLGIYNPIHSGNDLRVVDTNHELKYFQIPYIEDPVLFKNKIKVETITKSKTVIEY
tara:strand:+ start:525 stop:2357 length:1833 start_codon:yes stop_codon:yes gene_type:complete